MQIKSFAILAASGAAALAKPAPAHAQAWIGLVVGNMMAQGAAQQQEYQCMTGTALPDKEVVEARVPSLAAMQGYLGDAAAGRNFAARFNLDRNARWSGAGAEASNLAIGTQRDPFAAPGLTADAEPLGFVRAGDGRTALGQWAVHGAAGQPAGTYTAVFTRASSVWRLSKLTLTPASVYADPVVQFCHKPGDVLPYRLTNTRWMREFAEKRLARTEEKARRATDPVRVQDLTRQVQQRRDELATAQAAESSALADAKAADDAKAAAIARLPAG